MRRVIPAPLSNASIFLSAALGILAFANGGVAADTQASLAGVHLGEDVTTAEAYLLRGDPAATAQQAKLRTEGALDPSGTRTTCLEVQLPEPVEFAGNRPTCVMLKSRGPRVVAVALVFRAGEHALQVFEDAKSQLTAVKGPPTAVDAATAVWNEGEGVTAIVYDFAPKTTTVFTCYDELLGNEDTRRELDNLVGISLGATVVGRDPAPSTASHPVDIEQIELCADLAEVEARILQRDQTTRTAGWGGRQAPASANSTSGHELRRWLSGAFEFAGHGPGSVLVQTEGSRLAAIGLVFREDAESVFNDARSKLAKAKGPPTEDGWTLVRWDEAAKQTMLFRSLTRGATVLSLYCPALMNRDITPAELADDVLARAVASTRPRSVWAAKSGNIRAEPSLDAEIVGSTVGGKRYTVFDKRGDWCLIRADGHQWVHRSLVSTMEGKWRVRHDTSAVDDSPTVVLLLDAEASIDTWSAGHVTPTLVLRCQERTLEAYVITESAADVELGHVGQAHLILRFDEETAQTHWANEATDHKAVFLPQPVTTLRDILAHDRMLFKFTPFNSSPQEASFDLRGLDSVIEPLETACPWR